MAHGKLVDIPVFTGGAEREILGTTVKLIDWIPVLDGVRLRTWIAITIVMVWSVSAIVAFFTSNYDELGIITPVMMIVTGFIFGFRHEYILQDGRNPRRITVRDDPEEEQE